MHMCTLETGPFHAQSTNARSFYDIPKVSSVHLYRPLKLDLRCSNRVRSRYIPIYLVLKHLADFTLKHLRFIISLKWDGEVGSFLKSSLKFLKFLKKFVDRDMIRRWIRMLKRLILEKKKKEREKSAVAIITKNCVII